MIGTEGYWELIERPNPTVGTAFTFQIPGEAWTRLSIVRFTLTTSAAVANRFASVDIRDADQSVIARFMSPNALAASLVRGYTHFPEVGAFSSSAGNEEVGPLSGAWLFPGASIRITAANIDALDQISGVFLYTYRAPSGKLPKAEGARPWSP
jgi:hypothetical protein